MVGVEFPRDVQDVFPVGEVVLVEKGRHQTSAQDDHLGELLPRDVGFGPEVAGDETFNDLGLSHALDAVLVHVHAGHVGEEGGVGRRNGRVQALATAPYQAERGDVWRAGLVGLQRELDGGRRNKVVGHDETTAWSPTR